MRHFDFINLLFPCVMKTIIRWYIFSSIWSIWWENTYPFCLLVLFNYYLWITCSNCSCLWGALWYLPHGYNFHVLHWNSSVLIPSSSPQHFFSLPFLPIWNLGALAFQNSPQHEVSRRTLNSLHMPAEDYGWSFVLYWVPVNPSLGSSRVYCPTLW